MNDEELQKEIKQATENLGIDVPIMSTRVVGDRIELFLYGGTRVTFKAGNHPVTADQPPAPSPQAPPLNLQSYTKTQLLDLAAEHNIPYRSKMNKAQLLKALQEV